ncbi:MAG: nicotinate-nucleotide--dimethylbenzimidazole phosphoribosyltransferase [Desulfatiglandaceae bacterium]
MVWKQNSDKIEPVSARWMEAARERLDNLTKPKHSLGVLEELAARVVAITRDKMPPVPKKAVFVFAGDHGVVDEGVSPYPQAVTGLMVRNFLTGGAGINVLARAAGARVKVIDIGMKEDIGDAPGLVRRNVRRGTRNMVKGPAMTRKETEAAMDVGVEMAEQAFENGVGMVATGEMGIGNTTPSSAVFSALLPADAEAMTGRGTGLDDAGLQHKTDMIRKALEVNAHSLEDPLSTLAALGGLEIAGICGLCMGGAARRMVVVVDGFISTAGALVAMRLNPKVKDYLIFSHLSSEKGHRSFFEQERMRPLLDLDLRLGEGTGAALAMQIIEDSIRIYREMATFEEAGITPGP